MASEEEQILAIKKSLRKQFPDLSEEAIKEKAFKIFNSRKKERVCRVMNIKKKEGEEDTYTALAATTHPDRASDHEVEGDILSRHAVDQVTDYINTVSTVGGDDGAYRSVSLYHDWIMEGDATKDEAAFLKPTARTVELDDGHYGTEVDFTLNKFYKGDMTAEEIEFRIEQGGIAGLSIEYDTTDDHCQIVSHNGESYRFIEELTEFGGVGLARARRIANPHAIIYKEIEQEATKMSEDKSKELEAKEAELLKKEKEIEAKEAELKKKEDAKAEDEKKKEDEKKEPKTKEKKFDVKEILESPAFKEALEKYKPANKPAKSSKEDKMEGVKLHVKEMQTALKSENGKVNTQSFKEAARQIYSTKEYDDSLREAIKGHGIILNPSSFSIGFAKEKGNHSVKEIVSHKLEIVGGFSVKEMQTKDTLDTSSNTTTYTQAPVEFSDLYVPGLIDTFNNRTDLLDALPKVNHIMGTPDYGWRITASQKTTLSVDIDDPTVRKSFMDKVKLQTPIKEYRNGISVTDFMLSHSRASIGDLFMIEAEKAMLDMRKDMNKDLYKENADGDGTLFLGLEAVADSAGNTTLYGLTRSTANRLAPATATDTYTDVSGALTTDNLRLAYRKPWEDGAEMGNLLIVTSPAIRQALFELLDGQQQLFTNADFGFSGAIRFDGIPVLVDSDCPSTASQRQLYVIDLDSDKMVFSVPPQLRGLAKVSAAEEAYVMTNAAHVYERPRRIYMLDNLT